MSSFKQCKICNGEIELENQKYNLGKCINCKFIFCLDIFSQEDFIRVYDELYNKNKTHYHKHSINEFNRLIGNKKIKIGYNREKLIKKNILNGKCKSVLEIGSGIGLIGRYIKSKNELINYVGIEIDTEAFNKSQQLGLNTINADFKDIDQLNETFDVIMLWEVIEHLQDLKLFIELAYKKLNYGGKIILSTPNYDKIYNYPNRKLDQIFQDEPPIHLNFFNSENIVNVFNIGKFKNCTVNVKRFPYVEFFKARFYINTIKSFFNNYKGSSLYFEATKEN
jgi:2-polyprenyl-3-methyl-5-hydroxy-6-metoxy-1,4-benzoquinol methylase